MPDDAFVNERVTSATFLFEVDGVEIGRFMEAGGLEVSVETESVEEGGQNSFVHKLPGADDLAKHHFEARRDQQ